eukprot:gene23266-biopygen14859
MPVGTGRCREVSGAAAASQHYSGCTRQRRAVALGCTRHIPRGPPGILGAKHIVKAINPSQQIAETATMHPVSTQLPAWPPQSLADEVPQALRSAYILGLGPCRA